MEKIKLNREKPSNPVHVEELSLNLHLESLNQFQKDGYASFLNKFDSFLSHTGPTKQSNSTIQPVQIDV
jgi:hypothetical protein